MNDAPPGEYHVEQSEPQEVARHLVGHAQCGWSDATQNRLIIRSDPPKIVGRHRRFAKSGEFLSRPIQNGSSSPPSTAGWLDTICSTSVVPERGIPRISTGSSECEPRFRCSVKNSAVVVLMSL